MKIIQTVFRCFLDSRTFLVRTLRHVIKLVGGVMLSQRAYDQLLVQRKRAVTELVISEAERLTQGVVGVVFSKDRALQLYTLLSSYFEYVNSPAPLSIVYSASTSAHLQAYADVEAAFQEGPVEVSFLRERTSFRRSLLDVLERIRVRNIFFLVDDMVFIRPMALDVAASIDPLSAILSFRHSPHLRRSYTAAVDQLPPNFLPSGIADGLLRFEWFEQGNEWSDPWSVDGQVLSVAEVHVLTRLSDFNAPNSYEGALKSFNDLAVGREGVCYSESKALNLPINRVQAEVMNLSGNVSPEFLLEQWRKGMMLDTGFLGNHIPRAPHEEHLIAFKKRPSLSFLAVSK